jgi:hypothetical protein
MGNPEKGARRIGKVFPGGVKEVSWEGVEPIFRILYL